MHILGLKFSLDDGALHRRSFQTCMLSSWRLKMSAPKPQVAIIACGILRIVQPLPLICRHLALARVVALQAWTTLPTAGLQRAMIAVLIRQAASRKRSSILQ